MNLRAVIFCLFPLLLFVSCKKSRPQNSSITVFCAASLSPVLHKIKGVWEKDHPEKIVINSSSSGTLARQIENGAQADLFLSANEEWTTYLQSSLKLKDRPVVVASNQLVVVTPLNSSIDSTDFGSFPDIAYRFKGKISSGNPGHVPLGKYFEQSMNYYHLFDLLSQRMIMTKDARSALRLVELGEADLGFIYQSDALTSDKVRIISRIPPESHDPVIYHAIHLNGRLSVQKFLGFLSSDELKYIWKAHGFAI
ncbi:MAG: molybdate ABC transporter substrate-binding protein [Cytophagales bacterium]|nr:molybdate ABC transporter substrate-binding protein [Cytophagales bacterium]